MLVAQWARQISADPNSRMRVFNQFVGSPEFRSKNPSGVTGPYHLWANECLKSLNDRFRISTQIPHPGPWSARHNNVAMNYGLALMAFYMAFARYHYC